MKYYETKNKEYGKKMSITIFEDNTASVRGPIPVAQNYFKSINRKPPNIYGNFYGREKAGYSACLEILEKFKNDFELVYDTEEREKI